jgi:hypothetical protein
MAAIDLSLFPAVRFNVPVVLLLGTSCLASAGCSPPQTVVTGTVMLDGEPLAQAGLEFHGSGVGGFTGHAFNDANGQYRATVAASPLVVVIRAAKYVGMQRQPDTPGGTLQPEFEQYLPARYSDRLTTELRVTPIEGQTVVADFALTAAEK